MSGALVPRVVTDEEEAEYRARQNAKAERESFDDELGIDLEIETLQEQIFEMRSTGATFAQIAERFADAGIGSPAAAWRAHQAYVSDQVTQASDVDQFAAKQLAEIAAIRRRVHLEARRQPVDARPFTFAAPALIKLMEREAWLTGMEPGQVKDPVKLLADEELADENNAPRG